MEIPLMATDAAQIVRMSSVGIASRKVALAKSVMTALRAFLMAPVVSLVTLLHVAASVRVVQEIRTGVVRDVILNLRRLHLQGPHHFRRFPGNAKEMRVKDMLCLWK